VSWSPDGNRLATGSWDGTAKVWDVTGGRELAALKGHTSGLPSVSWSPHGSGVSSVSWSPDGKRLATGSWDGTAKVWDVAGGRELATLKGHTSGLTSVSWSPDGNRLTTESADGTAKVWEAAGSLEIQEWARQDRAVEELLALNAFRGPRAQGFIQTWLLLLPFRWQAGESGAKALDRQQLDNEAQLRPLPGEQARVDGEVLVWKEHQSPEALLNFNAVLGQVTERSVAYAICYLESERTRGDLWLQVASDDQAKVYLNGRAIYQWRLDRDADGLDIVGPVTLKQGTNVLLFKVVNGIAEWLGCVRLVDEAGRPAKDIRVKLTSEP
jgi:dipeptidyl aminopeptidase/acylaminoacyl peptidase